VKKRKYDARAQEPGPMIRLYSKIATPIFRKHFMATRCLNSTRVCLEVMRAFNVRAVPMSVKTIAMNKIYAENLRILGRWPEPAELTSWIADGAWALGSGTREEAAGPNDWPGHLVAVVQDFLVDSAAIQLSRPLKNIEIPDIFIGAVTPRFMKGKQVLMFRDERGAQLSYHARLDDTSYETASGFTPHESNLEVAAAIIKAMAAVLGRKPVFRIGEGDQA
jgi:hypothetical protein